MSKLAKINEFIYNYRSNQLENTIKFLTDMEEFIKENEIILSADDFINLVKNSSKLKETLKMIQLYKMRTNGSFIKNLLNAYKVINSHLDLEDKIILESLRNNFDESLRDIIFKKYINRIKNIIIKRFKKNKELDDYLQDAYEIFLTCINTFDTESNFSFIEYVLYKIRYNIYNPKEEIIFEELHSEIETNDIEVKIILEDFLERFNSVLESINLSPRSKKIIDFITSQDKNIELTGITKGTVGLIKLNIFNKLLKTNILDEYLDYLENPTAGKSFLDISRDNKQKEKYIKLVEKTPNNDFDILKELRLLGISENEIKEALNSMDEKDASIIYFVCGSNLNSLINKESLTPQEIKNFYSAKRRLISIISQNNNYKIKKTKKQSSKTFNLYEEMAKKGYTESEVNIGIKNLSFKDQKRLLEIFKGNLRNNILLSEANNSELKEIITRLLIILKNNKKFLLAEGALIEKSMQEMRSIYHSALSAVRSEQFRRLLGDIEEKTAIITFLNLGIIKNQKYSVSQIVDITGVRAREIRKILFENLELVKSKLQDNEQVLKLK